MADLGAIKSQLDAAADLPTERTPLEITPVSASVTINLEPASVPLNIITGAELDAIIRGLKGRLNTSQAGINETKAPTPSIIEFLMSNDKPIPFLGGVSVHQDNIVSILSLIVNSQNVGAVVYGTSNQAENVVRDLILRMWEAVGAKKSWKEIERTVELRDYTTVTVVNLGFSPMMLLSDQFKGFLDEKVLKDGGLGLQMGAIPEALRSDAPRWKEFSVVPSFEMLELKFSSYDSVAGRQVSSVLKIYPHTQSDRNRGRVKVQSDLPYEKHVDLLENLIATFNR